jgi:eukaryotic-like serine/threonine-protein kinase
MAFSTGDMIGQTFSKYRILEEIGSGSMGTVYKVQDTYLGRYAALKVMSEKYLNDREAQIRFEREGRAASSLMHPNICTVFDIGRYGDRPYLAMEFLQGKTLADHLHAGPLAPAQAAKIAAQVASALEAAHKAGIVHRDIKPANLFLTDNGSLKVLDFGLAKVKPRAWDRKLAPGEDAPTVATFVTMPGTILGTLAYMAPEQVLGTPVDGRADLFSLGIVLYEMCTCRLPIRGSTAQFLPGALGPVAAKLMALDPNARYQTATEAREALLAVSA